jgi:signal transduction histidine kinase/ActR/RegA family two-component response regulator
MLGRRRSFENPGKKFSWLVVTPGYAPGELGGIIGHVTGVAGGIVVSPDARAGDDHILILAPTGNDGEVTSSLLTDAGLRTEICDSLEALTERTEAAGAMLIAEEALVPPGVWALVEAVRRQPTWSDLPLVVLTNRGDGTDTPISALRVIEAMGNVTLLERPVRVVTLLSAMQSALRARRRQYEVRDHLEERRRAEAERERLLARERAARAEVEAANRAKDEFLAVLSHELRTPLQPILGWVKLLRNDTIDASTLQRGLETIERNARTQAQIVEDLLDVSRVIIGKLRLDSRPVTMRLVVEAAVDAVRASADAKSIVIDAALPGHSPVVAGDSNRLQQVVWNLLSNAVAFTPEGGRVTVHLEQMGREAVVRVVDTGQGIAPHFLPQIFERFRQADSTSTRRHGGLGLGLAIVRHLVELHGGSVQADSAGEGRGATFTIRLPLLAEGSEIVGEAVSGEIHSRNANTGPMLSGYRVLVVDDDHDTGELLTAVLGYYGAEVHAVSSAEAGLHAIDPFAPDVVISDVAMPGVDGYTFVRRLKAIERESGRRIPAMALTAHARASDSEQAFLAGFEAYVAKPVEPAELAQIVVRLIESRDRRSEVA